MDSFVAMPKISIEADTYSPYIRFTWKADLVEALISARESELAERRFIDTDLRSVQKTIRWQTKFDLTLNRYEVEGLACLRNLRCQVIEARHYLTTNVVARHDDILSRWRVLREASADFRAKTAEALKKHTLCKTLIKFSKRANAIFLWMELANEELTKPLSVESSAELRQTRHFLEKLMTSKAKVLASFEKLYKLDDILRSQGMKENPFTKLNTAILDEMWIAFEASLAKSFNMVDILSATARF